MRTPFLSHRVLTTAPLVVCATLGATAPAAAQEAYRLPGEQAAIWNLAGSISATGGGSAVTVTVRRGGSDGGRLEIGTGTIDLGPDGPDRVDALRILYPDDQIVYDGGGNTELRVRDDGAFFRDGGAGRKVKIRESGRGMDAHADLEVRIPRGHTVLVYLAAGDVEVSNVDGDLTVSVGSADVRAADTSGSLVLDTGSGDIELEGARGQVTLDTGSGDVEVRDVSGGDLLIDTGSGDVEGAGLYVGSLNVDTGSGDVTLADVGTASVLVDTGSGDVEVRFEADPSEVSVDTGSGGVTLGLPPSWEGRVEIETGSGCIHSDFRLTVEEMEDHYLLGRVGEGGGELEVDTGSGDVRLEKL